MGKNKRKHPDIEEVLARPWCYYCERDFDDLKILINHQKAKHFKCERCGRRLNTAGGLSVHMTQVHKETLAVIENALPNRSGLEVEIFGMEGIPEDIVQSHNQRVVQSFAQAEAERRAATGNAGQDVAASGAVKKPKFEAPSELKKRLAEHKAKKAAEEAAGIGSGQNTPGGFGGHGDTTQSPGAFTGDGPSSYPQQQTPFSGPPGNPAYPGPQMSLFQPPQHQHQHQVQAPPQQLPFQQQQPGFGPQGMPQYANNQSFAPPPQFQPPGPQPFPPQFASNPPQMQGPPPHFQNGPGPPFHNGPPQGPHNFHNGPPQMFGPGSSPPPFQQNPFQPPRHGSPPQHVNHYQPPRHATPPQHGSLPQRTGSLPPAPGLPQRPAFGAPPVNAIEMQQMHQGHLKGPPSQAERVNSAQQNGHPVVGAQASQSPGPFAVQPAGASTADDLVPGAPKDFEKASSKADSKPPASKTGASVEEKKGKKDKDRGKLVYSDNEVSPEEKMAQLPRYAFVPAG